MSISKATARISVILPTYRGDDWITGCLDSLAAQTLAWDDFEAVVIANGPRTRTPELVQDWLAAHAGFALRLLVTEQAGLCHARNLGLDAATGEYATFVDDDDLVGPRMLEALLAKARPGVVPMAAVGLFSDDPADAEFENWYTQPMLPYLPTGGDNVSLYPTLAAPWAKLVPVELARRVRFREDLRKNEERVFWMDVFAAARLQVVFAAWSADAAYLYRQRADSLMGRGEAKSWDDFALPWFEAASALLDIDASRPDTAELLYVAHSYMFGNFLRSYVAAHPEEAGGCGRVLAQRGLAIASVPWRSMFAKLAREVAFLGTTPVQPGAGQSLARRLAASAVTPVDVVMYRADGPGATWDEAVGAAGVPLDAAIGADGPLHLRWADFAALATRITAELEKHEATKPGAYLAVRSISASPVDHLLAALFKLARPDVRWTAELALRDTGRSVAGERTTVEADRWFQILGAGLLEAGYPVEEVPEKMDLFAELVTLGLADEIVFDSAEQAELAMSRCATPEVVARARSVVTVAPEQVAPEQEEAVA